MTLGNYWFVQGEKNVIVFNGMLSTKKVNSLCYLLDDQKDKTQSSKLMIIYYINILYASQIIFNWLIFSP